MDVPAKRKICLLPAIKTHPPRTGQFAYGFFDFTPPVHRPTSEVVVELGVSRASIYPSERVWGGDAADLCCDDGGIRVV